MAGSPGVLVAYQALPLSDEAPGQQAIGVAIAAMRDVGPPVDPDLWVPSAECSQCYQGCAAVGWSGVF